MTTQEFAELMAASLPTGYEFDSNVSTGGGCYAMVATAPDGRTMYATDGDASLPFSADPDTDPEYLTTVSFSYYASDDDYIGWNFVTVDTEFADKVRFCIEDWVDGDPTLED